MIILTTIIIPVMLLFFGTSYLMDIMIDFLTIEDDPTDIKQVEVVNPHDFFKR